MTYFGVLGVFVILPTLVLVALVPRDAWRRLLKREGRVNWESYFVVLFHVMLALVYTTPWDNYLVANRVWWYDPELVTGITFGWVPIEEYIFFVVQTLLTGLWTLALMRSVPKLVSAFTPSTGVRRLATFVVAVIWVISTLFLVLGPVSSRYLTLILSWVLLPVLIQIAFGADILLANWRLLLAAIMPPTLYLWLVDAIAIAGGTWTISLAHTTGIKAGSLPLEEMVFFLMTNLIIAFGVTLMLSEVSRRRGRAMLGWLKGITNATNERMVRVKLRL